MAPNGLNYLTIQNTFLVVVKMDTKVMNARRHTPQREGGVFPHTPLRWWKKTFTSRVIIKPDTISFAKPQQAISKTRNRIVNNSDAHLANTVTYMYGLPRHDMPISSSRRLLPQGENQRSTPETEPTYIYMNMVHIWCRIRRYVVCCAYASIWLETHKYTLTGRRPSFQA